LSTVSTIYVTWRPALGPEVLRWGAAITREPRGGSHCIVTMDHTRIKHLQLKVLCVRVHSSILCGADTTALHHNYSTRQHVL